MSDIAELMAAAQAGDADRVKELIVPFLHELLALDRETGKLTWKLRPIAFFSNASVQARWNGRYAGQPALQTIKNHGYRCGAILGIYFLAHRVVWAMEHGSWPAGGEVDHEDGIRANCRPGNLRDVTKSGNQRNAGKRIDNTSGHVGVYRRKGKIEHPWQASIHHDGRLRHLGFFSSKDEAIAARKAAEVAHGFHPNHGRA